MWHERKPASAMATARSNGRTVFDNHLRSGESMWLAMITAVLVESLVQRGSEVDLREQEMRLQNWRLCRLSPALF